MKITVIILFLAVAVFGGCGLLGEEELLSLNMDVIWEVDEEQGYSITDEGWEVHGKKVEVLGYMSLLTPYNTDYFYLSETTVGCCPYCGEVEVNMYELLKVYYPSKERRMPFTTKPIRVQGSLEVGELFAEEELQSVFRLRADTIEHYR